MFTVYTESPLFAPALKSVKNNKCPLRLHHAVVNSIMRRAWEMNFDLEWVSAIPAKEGVYRDVFGNYHTFVIKEIEG